MPLSRRGLIAALLAAPVVIRTPGLLMPISDPRPTLWGDGVHDDTEAMRAFMNWQPCKIGPGLLTFDQPDEADGKPIQRRFLLSGNFRLRETLHLPSLPGKAMTITNIGLDYRERLEPDAEILFMGQDYPPRAFRIGDPRRG